MKHEEFILVAFTVPIFLQFFGRSARIDLKKKSQGVTKIKKAGFIM